MARTNLLIGDIGGTNARFALVDPEQPGFHDAMTLQCTEFASADEAMRHYLDHQLAKIPSVICLAAAGPVVGDTVQITNTHWTLDATEIAADFGINAVRLLNDLEAVAYSIPHLQAENTEVIGSPECTPELDKNFNRDPGPRHRFAHGRACLPRAGYYPDRRRGRACRFRADVPSASRHSRRIAQ